MFESETTKSRQDKQSNTAQNRPLECSLAPVMDSHMGPQPVAENSDHTGRDPATFEPSIDDEWSSSLVDIMREVIQSLPESTSLGELIEATRNSPHLRSIITEISVQDLIDLACEREEAEIPADESVDDEDVEAASLDDGALNGSTVIRRRADVPGGDHKVLEFLNRSGASSDQALQAGTQLTPDQLRLLLRSLENRGFVHCEGRGPKKRIRITKAGMAEVPAPPPRPRSTRAASRSGRRRRSG